MKTYIFIFLLFCSFISSATNLDYGIYIKSYPYKGSEMSGLVLENGNPIDFSEETTLSFDMYVRNDNVFGNVFRIITDTNENIDLLFTVGEEYKRFPILVINESVHPLSLEIIREEWIPISISFSKKESLITLSYGTATVSVAFPVSKLKSFRTAFGLCSFDNFISSNVASINIKHIKLFKNKEWIRYWKLEKHNNELCYDSIGHIPAVATNPYWLVDDHVTWEKIYSQEMANSPSIAFNPTLGEFYLASDSKQITLFNTHDTQSRELKVASGQYVTNSPNQLLYISQNNALLSYNMDEDLFSFFSFENNSWSNNSKPLQEHGYWNNSISYYPADSSIVSFGGYGFYKYNNELLKKYPYRNKKNEKILLAEILPRYSSGSIIVGNTFYLFGGRGCKSGRQELFPRNYYDFYAVNLQTRQVNKLWEVTGTIAGGDFVSGENLIYDPDRNCFYMFTTWEGGTLMRITTDNSTLEPMSLPLYENIEAQFLYTNLYYSPTQKKLYALINKTGVDNSAEISIYSISYPPISVADLSQQVPKIEDAASSFRTYFILAVVIILSLFGFYYNRMKTNARKQQPEISKKQGEEVKEEKRNQIEEAALEVPQVHRTKTDENSPDFYDFSKRCICLLGGFHVRDKEGKDVTGAFTPTLKALVILLILHTGEDPKGIPGKKMIQLLWSDKNEDSAKNNRNVYLSKLRGVLEKLGDIEIVNQSGFWSIRFGENVVCDYTEAMRYYSDIKENKVYDETQFYKLLELLLRGTLLPNTEFDWIDRFKSNFSNLTIDTLSTLLNKKERTNNNFRLRIAETLFQHDYINEDALRVKCTILSESGKKGLAKTFYDSFCKEHFNLLGVEYKYSLSDILNRKGEPQG